MIDNVKLIYYDMPCRIKGFVKKMPDDFYYVVLNSRLNWEQNQSTLIHELEHIKNGDFDRMENVQEIESIRHL